MTPDLDALDALAEKATPGPWRLAGTPAKPWPVVWSSHPERGYQLHSMAHIKEQDPDVWRFNHEHYEADAAYIAALDPATVRSLIELARLGAAWEAAEAALPEGWWLRITSGGGSTQALGFHVAGSRMPGGTFGESGPTPAAALLALAAALRTPEPVKP